MKKSLLVLILLAVVGAAVTPVVSSFLGFTPAPAYAGDQGEDNDDQGENE